MMRNPEENRNMMLVGENMINPGCIHSFRFIDKGNNSEILMDMEHGTYRVFKGTKEEMQDIGVKLGWTFAKTTYTGNAYKPMQLNEGFNCFEKVQE